MQGDARRVLRERRVASELYEDSIMPMIETYHPVVIPASEEAITALMRSLSTPQPDGPGRQLHSAKGR
jgi:hypothetical protein